MLYKSSHLYFVRRHQMGNVLITCKCGHCLNLHCFALTTVTWMLKLSK